MDQWLRTWLQVQKGVSLDSLQQNEKRMDLKATTSHKDQTISSNCGVRLTLWKGNVDPDKEAGEVSMNSVNGPECALATTYEQPRTTWESPKSQ